MVSYDEFRVKDDGLSIRTKEYGEMGTIAIEGVEFLPIPPFEALNKEKFLEFLANDKNEELLYKANINTADVEKVIEGKIKEMDITGRHNEQYAPRKEQYAWIIIYKDPREGNKTKMAIIAEDGRYATCVPHVVETAPTKEEMQGKGFKNPTYTPSVEYETKIHLNQERVPNIQPY